MILTCILIPVGIAGVIYLVRKLRERHWGWVTSTGSLKGKIYIVTGANTGLGYETSEALVKRDATVLMACRSMERANEAMEKIRSVTPNGQMIPLELDLASFDSIRECAAQIKAQFSNFDCLINNAGLGLKDKKLTKENFEVHFGVNHLGHFLLFKLLEETIRNNNSRIVVVSSQLHERGTIDFDHLGKYDDKPITSRVNRYYNNSKLANFYFSRELYKKGFDCQVLCPGLCNTDFFRDYNPQWYHYVLFSPIVWLFLRSAKQGAQNIIYCATDNKNDDKQNPFTGYYVTNLRQYKSKIEFTEEISEKLWAESMKMCELK